MKNCVNNFTKIALKSLIVIVMLALSFMGIFSAPLMSVAQTLAATNYNDFIASGLKLLNLPKKSKLGTQVAIPFGETENSGDVVNVKILDPKGTVVFDNSATDLTVYNKVVVDNSNKVYKLTPDKVGTYKVQYSVESLVSGKKDLATQEYKIVVEGNKATMEFAENLKQIIPSVANDKYQIVLPLPTVTDSEGNDVANITDNLEIVVKDSYTNTAHSSNTANAEGNIIKTTTDGFYAFTPSGDVDCTYTINYIYTDAITGLETTEVFEVKYETEFDDSDIKLGYKFSGNMPETMELGVETTLPSVSVYDENNSEFVLSSFTDVSVVFVPNSKNKDKYTLDADKDYVTVSNSNKVTPMYPTTDGTYKITYKISDFYNLAQDKANITLVYTINDVKDSTAPVTYAVEDYKDALIFDTENPTKVVGIKDDFEAIDISYKIPTKVATNTEVYLPAIFAKDNFSKFENILSSFARVVVPESGSNKTVTTCYKEVDNEMKTVSVQPYETASYKFTTPGTYTIRYEATDEANKYNYKGLNFTIVVEDGFEDTVAPKITMTGIPSTSKAGETISFAKPSIVDYAKDSSTSTEVVDKNLEYGYYFYTGTLSIDSLKAELVKIRNNETSTLTEINEDENNANKLSFVAPESNVTVVVVAYDDAGNQRIETREISVVNILDTQAPTISTDDEDYVDEILTQTLKQDEIITLPSFIATDDNAKYLEGTVSVTDSNGNKISVIGAKYTLEGSEMSISNARFVATKSGEYTINYTINDIGGNYIVKSYIVSIADTKAPSIEIDNTLTSVEVGETVKIPTITVKDNGEVLTNPYTEIRFIGDNNPSYRFNNGTLEFTALETGVFTYEYYAKDSSGNETISAPYTIEAKDTQKPVITLDRDLNADKTHPIEKENNNILPIVVPGFTAEDTLNGIKESKIEVLSPSEKSLKVETTADGYSFVPTVDGIYTVKYIAIDNANNETIQTYSLRIGDNTAPSIKLEEDGLSSNAPEELKLNSSSNATLDLDLSKISVSDAGDTKTAQTLSGEYTNNGYKMFTVSVTGPDGSTITANDGSDYEYTLTKTGKYTITYTARDKAGNEKVLKKVVEVYADDNSSIISNETWSIVLIIGSLAVLAGVVIYFVKTRDKKPTNKNATLTNKEDKKD